MASQLVQDQLSELKQSVVDANHALQEFKMAHNLVGRGTGLLPTEQIPNLTTLLTNAKLQVTEAKGRLDRIQVQTGSEEASGTIFPDNQVILALRSKYLELSTKADELASRVGPNHLTVVQFRKEMNETRAAIRDEEKRLAGSYVSAYQAARTQYDDLAAMVAQLSEEAKTESQAQTSVRELENTADGLLVLYKSVLEQFSQLNRQPLNPIQDASIITRAAPQLHKNSLKSLAVIVGGFLLGLLSGAGGAIARELAAGVFRTPEQVKQATGIYCVSVPSVEASGKHVVSLQAKTNPLYSRLTELFTYITASVSKLGAPVFRTSEQVKHATGTDYISAPTVEGSETRITSLQPSTNPMLEELVLDAPHSRFTESLRNIKALADTAKREYGDKVIGVVSPVSKNGKSTVVTNLAALMAASARTLVIDGDLHKRQLTARLEPDAREGLIEALDDPSRLAALVTKRPRSGFDFLSCVLSKRIPNTADLLGSPQMERLLIAARESYDYIIVECPPIMSVVDVKMIERFLDRFVFVIEWGQTGRRVTQEALDECDIMRERTLCVVLNKVEPTALRSIEAYKGPQLLAYYET